MSQTTTGDVFDTDELIALARLDIEKSNIEHALVKLKQVLAIDNPPPQVLTMTARIYAQLGLFDRAKALFQDYLKANPDSPVENFQLGMAHFDTGEAEQALEIWESLLEKEPVHPPALFYKSLVLAQNGKGVDAKQSLEILLKSAPSDNLYFGKAKELLQAIDGGQISSLSAGKNDGNGQQEANSVLAKDAYDMEH